MNRADDAGSGESVSLSAESGQLHFGVLYAAGWLAWRHDQNLVGVIRAAIRYRGRYDAGLLEDRSPYVVIERGEG